MIRLLTRPLGELSEESNPECLRLRKPVLSIALISRPSQGPFCSSWKALGRHIPSVCNTRYRPVSIVWAVSIHLYMLPSNRCHPGASLLYCGVWILLLSHFKKFLFQWLSNVRACDCYVWSQLCHLHHVAFTVCVMLHLTFPYSLCSFRLAKN